MEKSPEQSSTRNDIMVTVIERLLHVTLHRKLIDDFECFVENVIPTDYARERYTAILPCSTNGSMPNRKHPLMPRVSGLDSVQRSSMFFVSDDC